VHKKNETTENMFNKVLPVQGFKKSHIDEAMEIFKSYVNRGVIVESNYDDNRWQCTDEYSNVGLVFLLDSISYARYYRSIFNMSCKQFIIYLKSYVIFQMGIIVLITLQSFLNDVRCLISMAPSEICDSEIKEPFIWPHKVIDFLSMLPENYDPQEFEQLTSQIETLAEIKYSNEENNQRQLAGFNSYFLFNDIINDFWESEITDEERLFFFPVYLWWKVTGVIPLRPREFLLTPRDCLSQRDGDWYITLRRNNLKGSNKNISYRIKDDYYSVNYIIPDRLAVEINNYIELTNQYDCTELGTLLVSDTHYSHWHQFKRTNSRFFTYMNLSCVLRCFFNDVIESRYNIDVVYDRTDTHLKEGQISYLYLGDTRHLALINIIAEGGGPVVAMMLAGHDNIETASHYYTNINSLIECNTYKEYRKVLNGKVSYSLARRRVVPTESKDFSVLENGDICLSQKYIRSDYTDCIAVCGPEGEIGYCPSCMFFRPHNALSISESAKLYQKRLEDDCNYLTNIVNKVRKNKGNSEDIIQALYRLQSSCFSYQQYCHEKLISETEIKNGAKTNN